MNRHERTTLLTQFPADVAIPPESLKESLWPDIYEELRRLAGSYMARGHHPQMTLQPTALVNEAFVRLVDHESLDVRSRSHFFAIAANAMRYILADYARKRNAEKRGGRADRVTLQSGIKESENQNEPFDALALHEALEKLQARDTRAYQIVELRFFAGLGIEQTADVLGLSPGTVKNEWRWARVWLHDQLTAENSHDENENEKNHSNSGNSSAN